MNVRKHIARKWKEILLDHFFVKYTQREYVKWKGSPVDWDNPRDINDKIQWLMCYTDTSMWTYCSDKYRVREYVKSKGLGDTLIPLLGVWKKAEDIDFDSLPEKFVIKCNHDSGSTHIVDKSKGFDPTYIRKDLTKHLKVRYGYAQGEMYYNGIQPLIIAEEVLPVETQPFPGSMVDYKIWCFDGKPYGVWACYNRTKEATYVNLYDLDWNVHPEASVFTEHYRDGKGALPRPKSLDKMLQCAATLSKGFPEVRVDLYDVDGKVYFSEMTFASLMGRMDFYTQDYLNALGDQCVLPPKTK